MTVIRHAFLLVTTAAMALGQRPSFAGHRPIGYPELSTTTTSAVTDELGNRFGEGDNSTSTTTQRLPVEANGDRDLVDRLSKLPVDNQPFWFINWQAIEASRKKPQTYPQRPSQFAGSQVQTQHDNGNFNLNAADTGISLETAPPRKSPGSSGNRDVNVSSFLANNNGVSFNSGNAGRPTPNPVNNDINSAANDGTLGNRFADEPIGNTNPSSTPVRPTQNVFSSSVNSPSTFPSPVPSRGSYPNLNYGQVVSSFQSIPFSYKPYSSSRQKKSQSTTNAPPRIVNGILTDDLDYPYPILDPKTRDPTLVTHNTKPLVNRDPSLRNLFRDYDFEEEHPILPPYGRRMDSPFYY